LKQIKANKSNTELKSPNVQIPKEMSIGSLAAATAIIAAETIVVDVPPTPRTEESSKFPHSLQEVAAVDLSFIKDDWVEGMIRDAMNAVVLAQENPQILEKGINVWDYLSTYEPPCGEGFMFSRGDPVVESVQQNMQTGHSGCTMASTMRHLQLLAKIGLPKYREWYKS
jgi:hypothetical protein